MRRSIPQLALLALLPVLITLIAQAARADISPEQVRKAISGAVSYLKQQQRANGSWPPYSNEDTGTTALCTLALLNAGVDPHDPVISKALDFLRRQKPRSTYGTALATMVFAKADPARDRTLIARNVGWFQQTQVQEGPTKGAWGYGNRLSNGDNSNSQFALLALHEAERSGVEVSARTWRFAKAYWEAAQNPDGSWGYTTASSAGTGSMTCAGIASLVITSGEVRETDATVDGGRIQCCQRSSSEDDRIERALQWLGTNFAVTHNPHGGRHWMLYYLYGVERVGRLTARRFIGDHDWYREGTAHLIAHQGELANYWLGASPAEDNPLVATSLALLFLSKGRRPVLLAKLRHGPEEQWNQHRGDVHNLTRYVESKWGLDLTWQAVDLRAATVDDLMQSPVLYFCGMNSPVPGSEAGRKDVAQKLRGYLDRGGFLFAEAYSSGQEFDRGFRELMRQVFPEEEYRLRLLPAEHPIWRAEEPVGAEFIRPLWGIDFGCRTSVVYVPPQTGGAARPSLSCLWELAGRGRKKDDSRRVRDHVQAGLSIGINVLAYATNRDLKSKDEIPTQLEHLSGDDPLRRGRLTIANLRHGGGCQAAPRALGNLMEAAARELNMRTSVEPNLLNITDEALFNHHLVFMHGRNRFSLTDRERERLGDYIARGGMLLANAICASEQFAASFRRQMQATFPEHSIEPIPPDDPIFSTAYGGFDLKTVRRRDPQRAGVGQRLEDIVRQVPPDLEGIRFGDRWGVVFSRFDLSCALEKQNSLECRGYVRQDAARIGLNVVLYSLQQ